MEVRSYALPSEPSRLSIVSWCEPAARTATLKLLISASHFLSGEVAGAVSSAGRRGSVRRRQVASASVHRQFPPSNATSTARRFSTNENVLKGSVTAVYLLPLAADRAVARRA